MALWGRGGARPKKIRVTVVIKGRIGQGWYDLDRTIKVAEGTTLGALVDGGAKGQLPLKEVIESSPHLRHTLMLNGDRCDVDENAARVLVDGDEIYLLAPLAGG